MDDESIIRNDKSDMRIKLYLIISIDTESSDSPQAISRLDLFNPMFEGLTNQQYWGYKKIIDICDKYHFKATFFVSVFECKKYGEDTLRNVCEEIKGKGHDVQLHTHPIWLGEKRYMSDHSIEEQTQILSHGKKLLEKWITDIPVAHRAGGYGVDENTLKALAENNFKIDSSHFFQHPNCVLSITNNRVVQQSGVIEVPVTYFIREYKMKTLSNSIIFNRKFVKTDIDSASLNELKEFIKFAKNNDLKIFNLFLHSYSLLKINPSFTQFKQDYSDCDKLDKILDYISNDSEICVISMRDFYEQFIATPETFLNASDAVPTIEKIIGMKDIVKGVKNKFIRIARMMINGNQRG